MKSAEEVARIFVLYWYNQGPPPTSSGRIVNKLARIIREQRREAAEEAVTCLDRYLATSEQERAFIRALAERRLDGDTAAVFADWLEDNGRTEAGHRIRLLRPAPGDCLIGYYRVGFAGVTSESDKQNVEEALMDLLERLGLDTWLSLPQWNTQLPHFVTVPAGPSGRVEVAAVIAEAVQTALVMERARCVEAIDYLPGWPNDTFRSSVIDAIQGWHGVEEMFAAAQEE